MTIFKEVNSFVDFPKLEKNILKFWEKEEVFEKLKDLRKNQKKFIFLEGPPTANGLPHVGHVLTRCAKDLYLRYQMMNGLNVSPLIGGWDCHGLPVEIEVEKELGINSKPEIVKFGIKEFNNRCRKSVMKYVNEWEEMTTRVGFWINMDKAYITMEDYYIESVWWSLKQLFEKGLLVKGHKVIPSCPRCEVTLSSHEYSQGLQETDDPSITVKFTAVGIPNTYYLAWTTTPWTLVSNVGLAINKNITYVKIKRENEFYYLAKDRLLAIFPDKNYQIIDEIMGEKLENKKYGQLIPYAKIPEKEKSNAFRIVTGNFVSLEEGTGIVHTAPAFGPEDYELAQEKKLPLIQPVYSNGTFKEEITPWAGMFIKDADKSIIKTLRKENRLITDKVEKHTSGFCWRCKTPILYYAREAWLIKMSSLREKILATNEQINWIPSHLKHGRFGDFLDNIVDWALSRERFWGTPLPIWNCACGNRICIGSKDELKVYMKKPLPNDFELHQPWIDEIIVYCQKCNKKMKREPFVIDCWFESGSAQFAQWHYPFENKEQFEEHYPIHFITEAIDQTRGWFYTLLAISTALFDKPAYMNCLTLGHVLDKNGLKMSKHIGNVVTPASVYDKIGADPMRWYFFSTPLWNPTRFSAEIVEDVRNQFFNTFWNVYSFFVTNINIDNIDPRTIESKLEQRSTLDKWLISKINSLIISVREGIETYQAHKASNAIEKFVVNDLSNWYIRRSRRRFWNSEIDKDKKDALKTLYEVLVTLSKIFAPFIPFLAEEVYQNLVRRLEKNKQTNLSVHLEMFPKEDAKAFNLSLEKAMDLAIAVVEAGRAARNQANIKVRIPLPELIIVCNKEQQEMLKQYLIEVKEELNVKETRFQTELAEMVDYQFKPKYQILGPSFKKDAAIVGETIKNLSQEKTKKAVMELKKNKFFMLETKEGTFKILEEQVEVISTGKSDYTGSTFEGGQMFLNTNLTPELIQEGLVRDIIRRVQQMRKDANLQYTQNIEIYYQGDNNIIDAMKKWNNYIKEETLAVSINEGINKIGIKNEWDIDGKMITIIIIPLESKIN